VNTKIRKRKKELEKIRPEKAKKKEREINLPSHWVEQKTQWFRGWDAEMQRYHYLYNPDTPTTKPVGRG
jgi:hypothetical protein